MEPVSQPITDEEAEAIYQAIFVGLGDGRRQLVEACDHSLKHTQAWAARSAVNFEELKRWLHANGGFCDCEVLFNVMPDQEEDTDE